MTRAEERLQKTYETLTKDSIRDVYESESIRRLLNRLEILEAGPGKDDSPAAEQKEQSAASEARRRDVVVHLDELRSTQKDSLNSDNPRIEVVIVKPGPDTQAHLTLLHRRVLAEAMAEAKATDEPVIREGIKEGARTTILLRSMYDTEEEVQTALKSMFVDQLMQLEQKDEQAVSVVRDTDRELLLTEEEEERFKITDLLEGAELARAMRERDEGKKQLLETKRQQLIKNRLEEAAEHRKELMVLDEEQLLDRLTDFEVMTMALLRAKEEQTYHYMLFCMRDPRKPLTGYARGERFVKGYAPFFATVEEVRDVASGMKDFWQWALMLKDRLDYLTEEDLFALSEYEPFRPFVQSMLRPGRYFDEVASLLGQGT